MRNDDIPEALAEQVDLEIFFASHFCIKLTHRGNIPIPL
jgi:hypothetical protein